MGIGLEVFLAWVIARGPALAQWLYRISGTAAGVWVRDDYGPSLALHEG